MKAVGRSGAPRKACSPRSPPCLPRAPDPACLEQAEQAVEGVVNGQQATKVSKPEERAKYRKVAAREGCACVGGGRKVRGLRRQKRAGGLRVHAHLEYMKNRATIQVMSVRTCICRLGTACSALVSTASALIVPSVRP